MVYTTSNMLEITEQQYIKYIRNKAKGGVIYKITNKKNGDLYIGSTSNFTKRYYTHINHIRINKQSCVLLVRAVRKYGEDNFKLEIIEECEQNILIAREQFYIDTLHPQYNVAKIAGSNFGIKRTEAVKKERSLIQKNKWQEGEYREALLAKLCKNWRQGVNHRMAKLTEAQVIVIKQKLLSGLMPKQISIELGVSYDSVKDIKRNKTWKNIII